MLRKSVGVRVLTSCPKRRSHSIVFPSVRATPLVCGAQASVTIMIFMHAKATFEALRYYERAQFAAVERDAYVLHLRTKSQCRGLLALCNARVTKFIYLLHCEVTHP